MFYAFCHNWSIVLCETKSKLFPARIPNYQAIFRKVWILYKFGFVEKSKLLDFSTMLAFWSLVLLFGIVWCWRSISCFRLLASLPYMSIETRRYTELSAGRDSRVALLDSKHSARAY